MSETERRSPSAMLDSCSLLNRAPGSRAIRSRGFRLGDFPPEDRRDSCATDRGTAPRPVPSAFPDGRGVLIELPLVVARGHLSSDRYRPDDDRIPRTSRVERIRFKSSERMIGDCCATCTLRSFSRRNVNLFSAIKARPRDGQRAPRRRTCSGCQDRRQR